MSCTNRDSTREGTEIDVNPLALCLRRKSGEKIYCCNPALPESLETSAVIASAAARLEQITLAGRGPRYRRSTVVLGLEHLEVRIERRHRTA